MNYVDVSTNSNTNSMIARANEGCQTYAHTDMMRSQQYQHNTSLRACTKKTGIRLTIGIHHLHVLLDPLMRFLRPLFSLSEQFIDALIRQSLAVVHAQNLIRTELYHGHQLTLFNVRRTTQHSSITRLELNNRQ